MSHTYAVVAAAPGISRVERVELPILGKSDVLVRTHYSGISSGTDKWVMQGRFTWSSLPYPVVPGYQRSGSVVAVGDDVRRYRPGDDVVALISKEFPGLTSGWGAHASAGVAHESDVYLRDGADALESAFVVSAQVGVNAASRVSATGEQTVLVIGDGIIGTSAALASRHRGFRTILLGRHDERLGPARALGLEALNSRTMDPAALRDQAVTTVIDTVQSPEAFETYIDLLPRETGQVVYSGHSPDGVTAWADMTRLQQQALTTHFVSGWSPERIRETLHLFSIGALPITSLVGVIAGKLPEIESLVSTVSNGTLRPTAAAIDWTDLQ